MNAADQLTTDLLAPGPFARSPAPWCLLAVEGPDARDFLQRLCSQDVVGLPAAQSRPAAFLDNKGKLQATCRLFRKGDAVLLETRTEQRDRLLQLLDRYHFTEKLQIQALTAWSCHEWIGAQLPAGLQTAAVVDGDGHHGEGHTLVLQQHGVATVRSHGAHATPLAPMASTAAQPLADDLAELFYMLQGLVRVGRDSEATTLALEAGLEDHCSTTKGCYTGQEIVARIHTYGHTNRRLCLLRLDGGTAITAPVELQEPDDGIAVGRVMRAVPLPAEYLPSGPQRLGVGYLPKDFQQPGQRLRLAGDGSAVEVLRA